MGSLKGLYTSEQVRQLEQLYARFHEGSTYSLMERAGAAVYNELRERWPELRRILVVCGKGNNGGDGFVVARLACMAGLDATVALLPGAESPTGDAERAMLRLKATKCRITDWRHELLEQHDVIVDAMLGTGIEGDVREPYLSAIKDINRSGKAIIAVDLPSGLHADSGSVGGVAIHAHTTVTFIGMKRGLVTGLACDYVGDIVVNDLKCGQGVFALVRPKAFTYRYEHGSRFLKPRRKTSHKGFNGHVLVIGGYPGYAGAGRMCAEAAARTGAGLVSLLTHPQHADLISIQCPEIMCHPVSEKASKEGLQSLLDAATVIAIGPGLSKMDWGRKLVAVIEDYLASQLQKGKSVTPTVWDADALNILSERPRVHDQRVLTPHPGEAARLLDTSTQHIQSDRFKAASQIADRFGGVCLLKGPGTIVFEAGKMNVVQAGNPGMATGGMGDVLTGIIAGLIAQGIPLFEAARLGAAIHGEAAELAVTHEGDRLERGLLATDLFPFIRRLVNPSTIN